MYLLDTNICIALLKENPQAMKKFNRYFSQCYGSLFRDFFVSPKIIKFCQSSNPINPHATHPTS